jgi:hypothetical protein
MAKVAPVTLAKVYYFVLLPFVPVVVVAKITPLDGK